MSPLSRLCLYVDPVVPVEPALEAAVEAARRSGASLHVAAAIGRSEDPVFETSFGAEIFRIVREDRAARLRAAALAAAEALGADRVAAALLEGEVPWHSLALHVAERACDLVVAPARPAPQGVASPMAHLFRKAPAPVWSVHAAGPAFPRRVLAAVDPGVAGSAERALARRVIGLAVRLGGDRPLELHVAHAWALPGEAILRARFGTPSARAHAERQRSLAEARLAELLAEAAPDARAHLLRGEPGRAVPTLAERLDADLVAVGTTRRSGMAGFLIGSTAEEILARLARSVVVVKPEGFVSPVRPAQEGATVPPRAA